MAPFTKKSKTAKKTAEVQKMTAPHYVICGNQIKLVERTEITENDEVLGPVEKEDYENMGKLKDKRLKNDRDLHIGCPICNEVFLTCCQKHPLFWVSTVVDRNVQGPHTDKTLPRQYFRISDEKEKGRGIRAIRNIPSGLVFGPFEGTRTSAQNCANPDFSWDIIVDGEIISVDGKISGNWLILVNSPDRERDANMQAFQHQGEMFYMVKKPIRLGEELTVWYGPAFGKRLATLRKKAEKK